MPDTNEVLNQWLRDAHAMEGQAEKMLTAQAKRLVHYPEPRRRIEQHIEETRSQRERLRQCLEARGTTSSVVKNVAGQAMAMMQGLGGVLAGDEVVKGTLAGYVFEHMEIASYQILVAAAEAVGDQQTAQVCREICREEEAMAAWLSEHQAEITRTYLAREDAALDEAKR